ncbi:MAG: hypothetical protein K0R82_1620 [Flavipsychrobacter sp.]|jgi:hypothetical protein|nr:hypothetical protein [Flavipsychrobacter sp.]
MIRYYEFESSVQSAATADFDAWKHLLPAIPIAFRVRFLYVLRRHFHLPDAFDIVMSSQSLTDERFEDFLRNATQSHPYLYCKE